MYSRSVYALVLLMLLVANLLVWVPVFVLWIECLAAMLPQRQQQEKAPPQFSLAVLVPAHNEELVIAATLEKLVSELGDSDQLIVVADNCSDRTGAIALSLGATVLERRNREQRGKGYALDYGLAYLANAPPDVVVLIDADCRAEPGAIATIASQAYRQQTPVQAVYLLESPPEPQPKEILSAFAFRVKNLVRPYGLLQLGLPCLLTGAGMAFPWSTLQQVSLASGNIVEDMQLGLDLTLAGYAPQLAPTAQVLGRLPQQQQAATQQRKRWEHGHLQTLLLQIPRLVKSFFQQGRWELIAIALELAVPPLSLLVGLWLLVALASFSAGILGLSWLPAIWSTLSGALILLAVFLAWLKFGRHTLSFTTLLSVPFYILWKIPLYLTFLVNPEKKWIRTKRD